MSGFRLLAHLIIRVVMQDFRPDRAMGPVRPSKGTTHLESHGE